MMGRGLTSSCCTGCYCTSSCRTGSCCTGSCCTDCCCWSCFSHWNSGTSDIVHCPFHACRLFHVIRVISRCSRPRTSAAQAIQVIVTCGARNLLRAVFNTVIHALDICWLFVFLSAHLVGYKSVSLAGRGQIGSCDSVVGSKRYTIAMESGNDHNNARGDQYGNPPRLTPSSLPICVISLGEAPGTTTSGSMHNVTHPGQYSTSAA